MDAHPTRIAHAAAACPTPPYAWHARKAWRRARLVVHRAGSKRRAEIEELIRREYLAHFGARIRSFMPDLVALHGPQGDVRAVVGCRSAAAETLFLEAYTAVPIEQAIAMRLGVEVPRDRIVEVGSLACAGGRAALEIVSALIPALIGAGYTWVVLTGSDSVRNVFRRLRLAPRVLCAADKSALGAEQHEWGTYYLHHPLVMAGRLADGIDALTAAPGVQ